MDSPTYIIRSSKVILPDGMKPASIRISGGRIADVRTSEDSVRGIPVEDFGDLIISPGLVDTHVHINEPGRTDWEGFEHATRAAAGGGITTLIEMPLNSSPVTTSTSAFAEKCRAAEGKLFVDCGFYGGLVPGNFGELESLMTSGVFGLKAFLIDSGIEEFPPVREEELRRAMPRIAEHELPLLVHCELTDDAPQAIRNSGHSYSEYLSSRPGKWERDAVELLTRLAEEYSCKVHIVHVSSSDTLPLLERVRQTNKGLITAETCPHYLFWDANDIADGDTRFKCAPPIRDRANREELWDALKNGILDFVVSDHSPAPPSLKCVETGDFRNAWGGISSLQFGLSIVWTEARTRGFGPDKVIRWMSEQPAAFAGLGGRKGRIAPGCDADLIVWDPNASFVVDPSMNFHRHKLTPYVNERLYGKVMTTFLRGSKVFENGRVEGPQRGMVLFRKRTNKGK